MHRGLMLAGWTGLIHVDGTDRPHSILGQDIPESRGGSSLRLLEVLIRLVWKQYIMLVDCGHAGADSETYEHSLFWFTGWSHVRARDREMVRNVGVRLALVCGHRPGSLAHCHSSSQCPSEAP